MAEPIIADIMAAQNEVEMDGTPLFIKYRDGSIKRLLATETAPASPDSYAGGAKSKDVLLDAATGLSVRLFLPEIRHQQQPEPANRLPVLLYFHGGAFCIGSPASAVFHHFLTDVAVAAEMLCVSVEYRLAPENRLPAAYDDCFAALRWLLADCPDDWVSGAGDLGRLFLAGDSAGGNILHEVALRARHVEWAAGAGVRFAGAVFLHPFFHDPAAAAKPPDETGGLRYDFLLSVTVPEGEGAEYPPFNPGGPRSPPVAEVVFRRELVAVAELDFLRPADERYWRQLLDAGVNAELVVSGGKGHGFFVVERGCPESVALVQRMAHFFRA